MAIVFGTPQANALISPEIKPCPFCGSTRIAVMHKHDEEFRGYRYCVECGVDMDGCGARGPSHKKEEDARRAWNKRAPEEVLP